jgi:uncharacterized protein (TIGR00255 family)
MTGYGRGEAAREGCRITVEISSVNRRQTDIAVNLPRELDALEPRVREAVQEAVARGRVNVRVALEYTEAAAGRRLPLNPALARAAARALNGLAAELKLPPVGLDTVLRVPGVLQPAPQSTDAGAFWPLLEKALQRALRALTRMRRQEGRHLAADLRRRIATLRRLAGDIRARAPGVAGRYREQLLVRIAAFGVEGVSRDDDRVLKEVAIFAERADISEELTRLRSHFQQFDTHVRGREPVGRLLDFLAQEMNREINTIGSKANDGEISRHVVAMKAELEKFREQVQNVE